MVEFQLTNGNGNPVRGLPSSAISFNVAKLIPGTDGNASFWQSYLNTLATATAPGAPGLGSTAIQATTENGSAGTLDYDSETATYTYTFATDVANVTTPLAVPYQPSLTHRITFEIRGFAPVDNPIYDFRPSDNATTGLFTREIVDTQTCNLCHNDLALHGGARADTDECVACHNPGTTDPDSLNTVDFKVMVHKIHQGEDLTMLPYEIWGFHDTLHDYSDVVFPQDIRNCQNCHNAANPNTPDASNWYTVPTAEACGSCHDDVNFQTGANHAAGPATNDVCALCHASTSLPALEVRATHLIPIKALTGQYKFNILGITSGTPGNAPVATFSITDPTNLGGANDPDGLGERYDLSGTPIADEPLARSNLRMTVAWDTEDYTNEGNGEDEAQPARTSIVNSTTDALAAGIVDNGDRSYTVTLSTVAASATGSGAVTFEGHPNDATLGNIPVTSAVEYFPITDATAQARRSVVDINGCDRCHDQLSLHGSNRVNNDQVCVTCHNPNATDLSDRPADAAGSCDPAGGVNVGVDGRCEQAIDFKYMVHAIHSSNITVYGFGASANVFDDVKYPQELSNCVACHKPGTYYPGGNGPLPGTTIQSVADYATLTVRTTGTDNIRITPWAAVCSSCHVPDAERDDPSSLNKARLHMVQNGANFALPSGDPVMEVCSICHDPGKLADVQMVHGVED